MDPAYAQRFSVKVRTLTLWRVEPVLQLLSRKVDAHIHVLSIGVRRVVNNLESGCPYTAPTVILVGPFRCPYIS